MSDLKRYAAPFLFSTQKRARMEEKLLGLWCEYSEASATIEALKAENKRLRAALEVCRDELDQYSLQEYPSDHPVHVAYRKRDHDANPARIALAGEGEG